MKKIIWIFAAALILGGATFTFAHGPQDGSLGSHSMNYCGPMHGKMMGQGMAMHGGWMGQGMMERGWMRGGWMCDGTCPWDTLSYTPSGQLTKPLTETQVQAMAEHYIANNPNLKIRKVTEKDGTYIVEIGTKKGNVLVDKMVIDKTTGMIQPVN